VSNPLIVYTAITGGIRDRLRPVNIPADEASRKVRYVVFTDSVTEVQGRELGWEVLPPAWRHADNPRRTARWHKVNSHECFPDAQLTLWLDGSHMVKTNPWSLVDKYLSSSHIATFHHGERNCVYQELEACIRLKKDDPGLMTSQIQRYRMLGYPVGHGLFETSVMLRRHGAEVKKFNAKWWDEIRDGSYRDQLSVNYVAFKLGVSVATIPGHRSQSPYFDFYPHR
jgi:hypothetical protein